MRVTRALVQVGTKAEALVAGVARRYGISHAALNALAVIEAADGPIPVGEVTARMHITTATTTVVIDTLERRGLVRRQPDPSDRRRVLVAITDDARALLDEVLPAIQQLTTATLRGIGDEELTALLDLLTTIDAALAAAPTDLSPPPARRH